LFNTEANRRLTFRGSSRSPGIVHVQSFVVFCLYCGFTSVALLVLNVVADRPARWVELVVLLLASGVGSLGRFVLLSTWVFRAQPGPQSGPQSGPQPVVPQSKEALP